MGYDSFTHSLREMVEELECVRGFKQKEDLDYELSSIYGLRIEVNPYEAIAFNEETANKYLSLLKQHVIK